MNGNRRFRFFHRLACALAILLPAACAQAQESSPNSKDLPSVMVFCGLKHNKIFHLAHGKVDWDYSLDGPVKDIQPQPLFERYLVTGGTQQVAYVRKVWKGCRVLWDWGKFPGIAIESAVVANWDENDNPTLVLAADSLNQRIFLADAKTQDPKIRWEYKLTAPPRRVHLCTDSGNFLVTLKDSTVEEVFYEEDKVVFTLGKDDGLKDARDAVRDPWANTYVADAATGDVFRFGPQKQLNWKTHLPFAPGKFEEMSLALFRKGGKRLVLAAVHFTGGGPEARNVVYTLNSETGKVLAWNDHDEKGGYPSFSKAVPDKVEYYKKQ